ncbi:hypothetical protein ACFV0C_22990 [Streptomyces sp. NPDC059568]|uniref:hypothetical protein n=1 Tax=Streptomyces sp. NPDC059568 TaxID=3346868 RepID=UPI0036C1F82C
MNHEDENELPNRLEADLTADFDPPTEADSNTNVVDLDKARGGPRVGRLHRT